VTVYTSSTHVTGGGLREAEERRMLALLQARRVEYEVVLVDLDDPAAAAATCRARGWATPPDAATPAALAQSPGGRDAGVRHFDGRDHTRDHTPTRSSPLSPLARGGSNVGSNAGSPAGSATPPSSGKQRWQDVKKRSPVATLPQLHVAGEFLGTFDRLQELEDLGLLGAILTNEGAEEEEDV
jgi:hypothetical protein